MHWVSLELDSGAIIVQEKLPKIAGESLQDFESRIHFLEHKLYPKAISVHWVSLELDSGAIIVQEKLPKIAGESLQDFESRIHFLEHKLYPKAIIEAIIQAFGSGAKASGQER